MLNRVSGMHLAEQALTALYLTHLREAPPAHWKRLFRSSLILTLTLTLTPFLALALALTLTLALTPFREAARMAYNLKYMFRESMPKAKARFVERLQP